MLPRTARLRSGREFRATYTRSQSYATPRLTLFLRTDKGPSPATAPANRFRVGFSISKKTARKAHERNLIKRRLREIVRIKVLERVRPGRMDAILLARSPAVEATFQQLADDVEALFTRAGAILTTP